jgi:LysR family hydrogen peroxide-inducible transcriptional activator
MNLRDLRYFIAVAETLHFGHAAKRCFVSQPTLSGQLKKLENEIGVTLFERTNKAVAITPIGEQLLVHARASVAAADALSELAGSYKDPLSGPLRVGAIPTLSTYLMPLILGPLRQHYPQMRLILSEEITEVLLQRLRNREIDVALVATPVDDPALQSRDLFDEPFWLVHPRDSELYTHDEISQQDLDGMELLLLTEGHCLAQQVMKVCHREQRSDAGEMADLGAASLETLLQLVGAGFGSTLIPALAVRGGWMTDTGVIARPIDLPDSFRRVTIAWRRSFPRVAAVEALIDTIMTHLPNTVRAIET